MPSKFGSTESLSCAVIQSLPRRKSVDKDAPTRAKARNEALEARKFLVSAWMFLPAADERFVGRMSRDMFQGIMLVSGNRDPQHSILQDLVDLKSRTSLSCLRSRCRIHVSGHPRIPASPPSSVIFLVAGCCTGASSDWHVPMSGFLPCRLLGCELSGQLSKATPKALAVKLVQSKLPHIPCRGRRVLRCELK